MHNHMLPCFSTRNMNFAVESTARTANARFASRSVLPLCRSSTTAVHVREEVKDVLVPTSDLRSSVQLRLVNEGSGQAIEVDYVSDGSAACQIGIKPGQKLRAIEDPVRSNQMYDLGDRPSLKFVKDAIMMSMHTEIRLKVEDPMVSEGMVDVSSAPSQAMPVGVETDPADLAASPKSTNGSRLVIDALDKLIATGDDGMTIAEQLEQQLVALQADGTAPQDSQGIVSLPLGVGPSKQRQQQEENAKVLNSLAAAQVANTDNVQPTNEVQARIKRRKEYLDQVSQRNDAPFFSWLFGAFVLPPAVVLGIAYATGYMDSLYTNALAHFH